VPEKPWGDLVDGEEDGKQEKDRGVDGQADGEEYGGGIQEDEAVEANGDEKELDLQQEKAGTLLPICL
jgi:hypothetical protein